LPILRWIVENHVGDLASLAGVAISVVGFAVTVWNVRRSKSAAERAETAANEARRMIRGYETISDFSAAIALMVNDYIAQARSICSWTATQP
jgi:hypothetical protein